MAINPAASWREILPESQVIIGQTIERYARCTSGKPTPIAAVVCPINEQQVIDIVRTANEHKIPIYPISTGHNWGYGSANPVQPNSVG